MAPAEVAAPRRWADVVLVGLLQLGAIAVVLVAASYKAFDLDRFFVPKELVLVVTACLAGTACALSARRVHLTLLDQALGTSLILGALSALLATNLWLAERSLAITVAGITCFWCARSASDAGYRRALVAALAVAGIVGALTSLTQAYGMRVEWFSLNRAPGGTFGNRNFMAHVSVITLPALLYSAATARSRGARIRWSIGIAMVAAALVLSRTRAAWLALLAALVVFLVTGAIALRTRDDSVHLSAFPMLMLAAALGVVFALVMPNTLDWRSENPYMETAQGLVNYKAGSGRGRLVQYRNSLHMSLRHPLLGVGPGNWPVTYPRFASPNDPSLGSDGMTSNPWPSSDWMTLLSERGVAATLALLLALILIARDSFRALVRDDTAEARFARATLLATLAAILTVGAFDAVTVLAAPALIAWSLLGALTASPAAVGVRQVAVARRLLAAAAVLVVLGAAAARSTLELEAMQLYSDNSRISMLERASALDPGNFRMHVRLAEGYLNRGSCTKARVHASAARALFPASPVARRLYAACGR